MWSAKVQDADFLRNLLLFHLAFALFLKIRLVIMNHYE